jgi:hypothetical protein
VPIAEVTGYHSIILSARASTVGATSMPSAFAVFKLITNSNTVGTFDWQLICLLSFQNTINLIGKQPPVPGIAILRHFAFAIAGSRSEIYLYDFNPVSELRVPGTSGSS